MKNLGKGSLFENLKCLEERRKRKHKVKERTKHKGV